MKNLEENIYNKKEIKVIENGFLNRKFKNKDGHVHTNYCPHGTLDKMEAYIIEAIENNLEEISFTEHMPLPKNFIDPSPLKDSAMKEGDIELYLREGFYLKRKYKNQIKINLGFEVDYIDGYEKESAFLLNQYGKFIEDSILSVHFIKGNLRYYCIDFSVEEFRKIINDLGSIENLYEVYYDTLIRAIKSDLGMFKPKRIGHLNLVRKFNKEFPYDYTKHLEKIEEILSLIKDRGYELDFNLAGLRKKHCGELYLEGVILKKAIEKNIPLILGSDSHSSKYIKEIKSFL